MGLMDQLGQAVGGMLGGQGGQNPLLQAVAVIKRTLRELVDGADGVNRV